MCYSSDIVGSKDMFHSHPVQDSWLIDQQSAINDCPMWLHCGHRRSITEFAYGYHESDKLRGLLYLYWSLLGS